MFCTTYLQAVLTATSTRMTRRFSQLTIAAIVILFSATLAQAQPAATGTIRGKVINSTNGAYLKNATITVPGTNFETFSDEYGEYVLKDIPAGETTIKAEYIGEPQQSVSVTVVAGQMVQKDFSFRDTATTQVKDGTVALDPLVVNAQRYHNAQVIAIAEERHSVNIKNVVSTDAFGNVPNGNIGEFVKFLPGVQVDYGAVNGAQNGYSENTASGVSVRGFGPEDTAILIDGMPVSNATPGSLTRQVSLSMLSINNAARVELIKVATPDMPNNSVGGQINLITKSAFEYAKPTYNARVFFNFNSLNTDLDKSPGPVNKNTYKTTPGAQFSVSYPFSKTFGVTVTGYAAREFDQTFRAETTNNVSGSSSITNASGVQSVSNPLLSRFKVTDIPRMVDQNSANVKLDWKPSPSQTLSANVQYSTYDSIEAQRRLDMRPTIAAGTDWGPTYVRGTTANSTLDMTVNTVDTVGDTTSGQLTYKFQRGGWNISAAGSISVSNGEYVDRANRHFSEVGMKLNPGQIVFDNIVNGIPKNVVTFKRVSNGGAQTDYTQLSNWGFDNTIAKSSEANSKNTVGLYKIDIERALDFIPWLRSNALTFKIGARRDQNKNEKWGAGTGYTEVLDTGKSYLVSDILDTYYAGVSPGFGYPAQQWASTYKLFELNQTNKLFVAPTDGATAVGNWNSYVGQQKSLTETTDGAYAMLSGQFLKNRLSVVAGVRQERKSREGYGPFSDGKWNYAKNADGTFYRDSFYKNGVTFNGQSIIRTNADGTTTAITNFLSDTALLSRLAAAGIKYPDHLYGATASSLEAAKLLRVANRHISQDITGEPSGSVSASYALTKKIDLKAAWSRSFKLPSLEDGASGLLSGNGAFTMSENETPAADGTEGTINVANPGLLPETSNNWDFQVAYYTDKGGKLAVSYFTKSVTNQSVTFVTYSDNPAFAVIMDALGLDANAYANWKLTTSSNSSTVQKTHGVEFEARQDLAILGGWGKHFQLFATYTQNSLGTPATPNPVTIDTPSGTPLIITPTVKTITLRSNRFATGGIQFATQRFSVQARGVYKNANELSAFRISLPDGNFVRRFEAPATRIDLNFEYLVSKHYSVFLSGRDVFNGSRRQFIRDDKGQLPAYAQPFDLKKFGVTWTVGVNGTW